MDIIVFCDKNGKNEFSFDCECEFRLIEVCKEDEQNIHDITSHSIEKGVKFTKVHVLDESEYFELKTQASKWIEYVKWKNAKDLYEENKDKYEI